MFNLYFCNVHKSFPSDTNPVITNNAIGKIRSNIHDNHNETLCTAYHLGICGNAASQVEWF